MANLPTIDHSSSGRIFELIFNKLSKNECVLKYPYEESLSNYIKIQIKNNDKSFSHKKASMFASASIEMWLRAVHSFLCSVSITEQSRLWASVSGYYASHYVMRGLAHSFGFFKSFTQRKCIQLMIASGHFEWREIKSEGEHRFYWNVVSEHNEFKPNPLFKKNLEMLQKSDSSHRNYANYIDHLNNFTMLKFCDQEKLERAVETISNYPRNYITEISEKKSPDLPDLKSVQILAYQRIVTFRKFLNKHIPNNKFWIKYKEPIWCRGILDFHLEDFDYNKRDEII